jgi:adenylate cyclase class IV
VLSPCRHRVRSLIAEFFTQIEDAAKEQKIISKLGLQAAFKIENRLSKTAMYE